MIKILVVDDEPDLQSLIRQRFRQMIREQKFNFSFAVNGLEAIRLLKNGPKWIGQGGIKHEVRITF